MTAHCLGFGADLGELARSIHKESFERLKLTAELLERVASASLERLMQELPTEGRDSVKLRCKDLLQILS